MQSTARQYVDALRTAHAHEDARRAARRQLRSEVLRQEQDRRRQRSYCAMQDELRRYAGRVSVVERQLYDSIARRVTLWNGMCERAIDHSLERENAMRELQARKAGHLGQTLTQEQRVSTAIADADKRRWALVVQEGHRHAREAKEQAVSEAITALLRATEACIEFMHKYDVTESRHSVLMQFALRDVTRGVVRQYYADGTPPGQPGVPVPALSTEQAAGGVSGSCDACVGGAVREAFRAIFDTDNPFARSGLLLRALLAVVYHKCERSQLSCTLFDLSAVPIFIVDGPKLAGKSVLTEHLVHSFGLRHFTDRALVQRALDACARFDTAADASSPHGGSTTSGTLDEKWASVGRRLRQTLRAGGAVETTVVAQLFQLQLAELQAELGQERAEEQQEEDTMSGAGRSCGCTGVVFDGVLTRAEEYKMLQRALLLLPLQGDPYATLVKLWCAPLLDESNEEGAACQTMSLELLQCPVLRSEEPVAKKEPRTRATHKAAESLNLPPPELPIVEDVTEQIAHERALIAHAEAELASYAGLFTAVLHIDCNAQTIFERCAGLRVDRETGASYHLTYRPPPLDRLPYLVRVDRTVAATAQLHRIVFAQEQQWSALRQWLHNQPGMLQRLHTVNGNAPVAVMQQEATGVVTTALHFFTRGKELYKARQAAQTRLQALQQRRTEQLDAREAARQRLAKLYSEKNVPLPPELEPQQQQQQQHRKSIGVTLEEVLHGNGVLLEQLSRATAEVVLDTVAALTEAYAETYSWAWTRMGGLAQLLLEYRASAEEQLQRFWQLPDDKQLVLDRFIAQHRALPQAYRSHVACKEEMHLCVQELQDVLFTSVDRRRRECLTLTEHLMRRSTYLDGWETNVCNVGVLLLQAEMERFIGVANLVIFYFGALLHEPYCFEEMELDVSPIRSALEGTAGEAAVATMTMTIGGTTTAGVVTATTATAGGRGAKEPRRPQFSARKTVHTTTSGASNASGAAAAAGLASGAGGSSATGTATAAATAAAALGSAAAAVGSGAAAGSTASGRAAEDGGGGVDRGIEDCFGEVVQRLASSLTNFVDKVRASSSDTNAARQSRKPTTTPTTAATTTTTGAAAAMNGNGAAATSASCALKIAAVAGRCVPLLEQELTCTLDRLVCVRRFVAETLQQGEAYTQNVSAGILREARRMVVAQASAVNTAVDILRRAIEAERPAPAMHLGCGTFALLDTASSLLGDGQDDAWGQQHSLLRPVAEPSFLTDVPLFGQLCVPTIDIHPSLTAPRLVELIRIFHSVAPSYQLSRENFRLLVSQQDYAAAAIVPDTTTKATMTELEDGTTGSILVAGGGTTVVLKSLDELFDEFDRGGTGVLDWREFVVHLLFWCRPVPPRRARACGRCPFIPELTMDELRATRRALMRRGTLLSEADFAATTLFFDVFVTDAEVRAAYRQVLWFALCDRTTRQLDPALLLWFLCADRQPIRGVQKAFCALAPDETERLSCTALEHVFHVRANHARAMGQPDAFSQHILHLLYGDADSLSFDEACASVMGRNLFNSADTFRRKQFVTRQYV